MNLGINGQISKDFPLFHSEVIPIYQNIHEKKYEFGKRMKKLNSYTNEHPDLFRLNGMKESGYRNPYLNEVIKVDRNEQFKKMDSNAKQISIIDLIKSNRKYSQDPKVLKYIKSEFDIQMQKKRHQISEDRKNRKEPIKYVLTESDIKHYDKMIKKLDEHTQKIDYKMKHTLNSVNNISPIGMFQTLNDNFNKIKQISCQFDPYKSSYITNANDYKISEAYDRDKNKEFTHKRRCFTNYNLINYETKKIIPPPFINQKWSSFYENYYMMMLKNQKGFGQKGGLFTEFTNKNIGVINVNKRDIREKLQLKKLTKNFTSPNNKSKSFKNFSKNNKLNINLNFNNLDNKYNTLEFNYNKFKK